MTANKHTKTTSDAGTFGNWETDSEGLPAYRFEAALPVQTRLPDGRSAQVPDDPVFLVGNDGLKLFVHASGRVEWLSGAREWARLNSDGTVNAATGTLDLRVGDTAHALVGAKPSVVSTDRQFGVGFASWNYRTSEGVGVEHRVECPPTVESAPRPNRWVETLVLTNTAAHAVRLTVKRSLPLHYAAITQQRNASENRPVSYRAKATRLGNGGLEVAFTPVPGSAAYAPVGFDASSPMEWHPPRIRCEKFGRGDVRMNAGTRDGRLHLTVSAAISLAPGESRDLAFSWTAFFGPDVPPALKPAEPGGWRKAWARNIPDFPGEASPPLRRELRWHAAMLLALAQWSQPYGLRFLPQGTSYEFDLGWTCSARDHLQHALPFCHLMPWLAADSIRHACRKMTPAGEIRLMENGPASTTPLFFATSDQQLFFFGLLAEYLETTGDASILAERHIPWPPQAKSEAVTVLEHAERAYQFLRDEVGRGARGLVRLLNSDWNDGIYWVAAGVPFPEMYLQAESLLNTSQACVVLNHTARALSAAARRLPSALAARARSLSTQLAAYRSALLPALLAELKGRDFLPRAYTPQGCLGDDQMWLEPQVFALAIPEIPLASRRRLLREIMRRLGEPWGLRQQERPAEVSRFKAGGRENGGVWFALIGPTIVNAASVSPKVAWQIFHKFTLAEHARRFPAYWPGIWTGPDNFESSLLPSSGLPDQQEFWPDFPVFCSHAHAWPLYAYLKLRKDAGRPWACPVNGL